LQVLADGYFRNIKTDAERGDGEFTGFFQVGQDGLATFG
jgi:hypothetical protein